MATPLLILIHFKELSMALSKTLNLRNGLVAQDAYHRIEKIQTSGKARASAEIWSYVEDLSAGPIQQKMYSFPYSLESSDNMYVQAYNHLKTLPDFEGATDV
jgi:hypothetical protein